MTADLVLRTPYLIFVGDASVAGNAKTARGVHDWAPEACLAQIGLDGPLAGLDLPEMTPAAAAKAGARSLLIGVATGGGNIPERWEPVLHQAIEAGLDIVSGLHRRLDSIAGLAAAAARHDVSLVEVRVPRQSFPIGSGARRAGRRILTVGTDCALGKKYTALALAKAMRARGLDADFRATGQTGIMIAGRGIAIDAVVADFISGAAEVLSPATDPTHWDVIEGQGSLFHPAYAGVTTGLVHGSQPDALILCHEPGRTHIKTAPGFAIPSLDIVAARYLDLARLTNPNCVLAGISLNTATLSEAERVAALETTAIEMGVPCFDPLKSSANQVIDAVLRLTGGGG